MASDRKTPVWDDNPKNPRFRQPKALGKGVRGKPVDIAKSVNAVADKRNGVPRQGFNPFR